MLHYITPLIYMEVYAVKFILFPLMSRFGSTFVYNQKAFCCLDGFSTALKFQ